MHCISRRKSFELCAFSRTTKLLEEKSKKFFFKKAENHFAHFEAATVSSSEHHSHDLLKLVEVDTFVSTDISIKPDGKGDGSFNKQAVENKISSTSRGTVVTAVTKNKEVRCVEIPNGHPTTPLLSKQSSRFGV